MECNCVWLVSSLPMHCTGQVTTLHKSTRRNAFWNLSCDHAHCFFVENSMSCVKGKTNKATSSKWGVIFFMYSNHISYKGHANLQWIIHHIFIEFSLILLYKIIYIFFSSKKISERGIGNGIDSYYFLCLGVLVSISLFNFTIL